MKNTIFSFVLYFSFSCAVIASDETNTMQIWENAKESVREKLVDPYSAKFKCGRVKNYGSSVMAFGQVNAKNKMGGYTGYREFAIDNGRVVWLNSLDCGGDLE